MNKKTYKALVKKTQEEIAELEKIAGEALDKAVALSEAAGVPFDWRAGTGVGGYIPKSLPKFDVVFLAEVTGFDSYYLGEDGEIGWLSSYC